MAHGDITHLEIPVTDTKRSAAFYHTLFGWQIEEIPGFEGYPMWRNPNQISGGGLTPRSEDFTQPRSMVEVDSIEEVAQRAEREGGTVLVPRSPITENSWWAVITDLDGNHIGLYEDAGEADPAELAEAEDG